MKLSTSLPILCVNFSKVHQKKGVVLVMVWMCQNASGRSLLDPVQQNTSILKSTLFNGTLKPKLKSLWAQIGFKHVLKMKYATLAHCSTVLLSTGIKQFYKSLPFLRHRQLWPRLQMEQSREQSLKYVQGGLYFPELPQTHHGQH